MRRKHVVAGNRCRHRAAAHRQTRALSLSDLLRGAAVVVLLVVGICVCPSEARAGDFEDLVFARDAYNNSDYDIAIPRLQALLDRQPAIDALLAESARKYLFASLVLTEHREQALALLERVLRDNPDVQFAPRDFSGAVLQVVTETRTRLAPELERIRIEHVAAARAAQEARERRRQALLDELSHERVTVQVSRAWMFFPFGIGQFVNGSYGWGAAFVSVQSLALATATISYGLREYMNLPDLRPDTMECHRSACTGIIVANVVGWSVFGAAVVAGIVQANVAFRPERSELRRRPVPPNLQQIQISASPTPDGFAVGAMLRF